jgi:RNA polymerase sigma-70 factor (ECF subfamily)
MPPRENFSELIRRIRAGDEQAAVELVNRFEPAIRREIRLRLRDPRLQRVLDSLDICQSVLKSFFVRAAAGQYDLEEPDDLVKLLVVMARNKLAFQARRERAQRRDYRRLALHSVDDLNISGRSPGPSELAETRELLVEMRNQLSAEERQIADLRADGRPWSEVAAQLGGNPEARRMQLGRAIDRIASQLGLNDAPLN